RRENAGHRRAVSGVRAEAVHRLRRKRDNAALPEEGGRFRHGPLRLFRRACRQLPNLRFHRRPTLLIQAIHSRILPTAFRNRSAKKNRTSTSSAACAAVPACGSAALPSRIVPVFLGASPAASAPAVPPASAPSPASGAGRAAFLLFPFAFPSAFAAGFPSGAVS